MKNRVKAMLMIVALLFLTPVLLTGCKKQAQSKQDNSPYANNTKIKFYHGEVDQSAGIITIPVIMKNNSDDDTQVKSSNFTLLVAGHKIKPFNTKSEPSDYHDDFNSGSSWTNIISFYLGTTLTPKEISKLTLIYQLDSGKEIGSAPMSMSEAKQMLGDNSSGSNTNSIATYYSEMSSYTKDQKDSNGSSGNSSGGDSLKDQFNDAKYDHLRTWIAATTKNSSSVVIKISNQTNTDFVFNANEFELVDKNGQEIQVAPNFYSYTADVLHSKYLTITLPMETKLSQDNAPYTVRFKSKSDSNSNSGSSDFESTKNAPYPVEFLLNNARDYQDLYFAKPDEFSDNSIKFNHPRLNIKKRSLNCNVTINDYFGMRADAKDFKLVGLDKDGSQGDEQAASKGAPMDIPSGGMQKFKLEFDSLSTIKTYKHIVLKYRDKTLMRVR